MGSILKVKKIFFLVIILTSTLVFADKDVEFIGRAKNTGKPCTLTIISNTETENPYSVDVEVTFFDAHEGENELFEFSIKGTNRTQGFNIFSGENGRDQLNIFTPMDSEKLNKPIKFAIKWLHDDHFHSELCDQLKINE